MKRHFFSGVLCAALLLTTATPALAWRMEKQDLSQIEVTFDPSVDPATHIAPPSTWAKPEVDAAIAAGLVPQFTIGAIYTADITREQFAELMMKTIDVIAGGDTIDPAKLAKVQFSDSDNKTILRAAASGVVNGIGGDRFAPSDTTNREQISCMMIRSWNYLADQKPATIREAAPAGSLEGFTDAGEITDWAVSCVGRAVGNGLMKGTGDGTTLSSQDECTVEQAILLCYRLYTKITAPQ
ncbi:MAG: S-layer homology domain-containing protein [Oscillospiraceae bacterium]